MDDNVLKYEINMKLKEVVSIYFIFAVSSNVLTASGNGTYLLGLLFVAGETPRSLLAVIRVPTVVVVSQLGILRSLEKVLVRLVGRPFLALVARDSGAHQTSVALPAIVVTSVP